MENTEVAKVMRTIDLTCMILDEIEHARAVIEAEKIITGANNK